MAGKDTKMDESIAGKETDANKLFVRASKSYDAASGELLGWHPCIFKKDAKGDVLVASALCQNVGGTYAGGYSPAELYDTGEKAMERYANAVELTGNQIPLGWSAYSGIVRQ